MMQQRRVMTIPAIMQVQHRAPAAAAAAVPWWLSGGITAANCIAAYTPKGAASLAASYDNNAAPGNGLADGTYDAAPGVAPAWAAGTGWTFNGITQWLNTGITPVNNQAWSLLLGFSGRTNASSPIRIDGDTSGYPRFGWYLDGTNHYYYNGNVVGVSGSVTHGVLAIAGTSAYRDGADEGVTIGSRVGSYVAGGIPIGGRRETFIVVNLFYGGNIEAVAIYNTTLTAPQVVAISSAMSLL